MLESVHSFISLQRGEEVPGEVGRAAVLTVRESEGDTYLLPRHVVETLGYQVRQLVGDCSRSVWAA